MFITIFILFQTGLHLKVCAFVSVEYMSRKKRHKVKQMCHNQ